MGTPDRTYEVSTGGPDPSFQLQGSDPFASMTATGLMIPTAPTTFVYDVSTQQWCEWNISDPVTAQDQAFPVVSHLFAFGKHLMGSALDGALYECTLDAYEDQFVGIARPAPVLVQQKNFTGNSTTPTVTMTSTLTAGSLVVLTLGMKRSGGVPSLTSISGAGVTWQTPIAVADTAGFGEGAAICYGLVTGTPGTVISLVMGTSTLLTNGQVSEWSDPYATSQLRDSGVGGPAGSTLYTPGTCNALVGELVVAVLVTLTDSTIIAGPSNSFTSFSVATSPTAFTKAAYLVSTSTGPQTTNWTMAANEFVGLIASFARSQG